MPIQTTCFECGSPLSADAPEGNCPTCLLRLAIGGEPTFALRASSRAQLGQPLHDRYFADYEILGEIARGGMGVVFRARQVSLNRPVALKMILDGQLAGELQVRRFQLEAEAAARLDHPNIVSIYEIGVHEGRHYYSMKLIDGEDLAARIKRGAVRAGEPFNPQIDNHDARGLVRRTSRGTWRESVRLMSTIARAVHYAHQHGVLHRDLKPTNILLAKDGTPFVTDFGIARVANENSSGTQTVAAAGTPSYMAPEQLVGSRDQITTSTDIYGLGAILYEVLTGEPPFTGTTPLEVAQQAVAKEPRAPRQMSPGIDRDLEIICLKCLCKMPGERYSSALVLAEDLERWLNHEPIVARHATAGEKLVRWIRRNPKPAAIYSLLAILLFAGAAGSTIAAMRIKTAEQLATQKLFESYLAQAHAERRTSNEGRRAESLAAIRRAALIKSTGKLRNEAVAVLALTDLSFTNRWSRSDPQLDAEHECCDAVFQLRAFDQGDGQISVRRIVDDREVAVFPGLGASVRWLYGFSPHSKYLAAAYWDNRTAIWNVRSDSCLIQNIPGGASLDYTRDDASVIVSCQDGHLHTFNLSAAKETADIALDRVFHIFRIQPGSDRFAACRDNDSELEIRRVGDGQLLKTLSHPGAVGTVAWSDDGQLLAVGLESGRVLVWNIATSSKLYELEGHQDNVVSLGFSHDGWLLGGSSWDGHFRLWDLAEGALVLTAAGYGYQTDFSPDDARVGSISRGPQAGVLEINPSPILLRLNCSPSLRRGAWSLDVSPDGAYVASACGDGVRVWQAQTNHAPFFLPLEGCRSVLFSPDASSLLTCGPGGIHRWPIDRTNHRGVAEFQLGDASDIRTGLSFNFAALSSDGRWIAAANNGAGSLAFYEIQNPSNKFALVQQPRIHSPTLSANGRWAAAGNWKASGVKVWDLSTREELCTLPVLSSASALFSPDSAKLVTSGTSYELWSTANWQRLVQLTPPHSQSRPGPAVFSPDGALLAINSEPNIVELIDPNSGQVLADLEAPQSAHLAAFQFSPDSSKLYALEWSKQVQVWDIRRIRAELSALGLNW